MVVNDRAGKVADRVVPLTVATPDVTATAVLRASGEEEFATVLGIVDASVT
jgi:hypothetical protein